MKAGIENGLAGLVVVGYVGIVAYKNRLPLLAGELARERGFVKWLAAFLIWRAIASQSTGKAAKFLDAVGGLAIASALVIGVGRNSEKLNALAADIRKLVN